MDAISDLKAEMLRAHKEAEQLAEMAEDDKAHAAREKWMRHSSGEDESFYAAHIEALAAAKEEGE